MTELDDPSVFRRWVAKVDKDGPTPYERPDLDSCWQWTASLACEGYGRLSVGGRRFFAHRLAYEHFVSAIPKGLQVDHLCRNRGCVNPQHLEVVTRIENVMRGESPLARNARKTHCKHGHEFTVENTYIDAKGRACRTCHRTIETQRREARRAN